MRILALILSLTMALPVSADTLALRDDAPDRHVVVKGDTLWDISAKFLKSPWKWPELWRLNKVDIKNPHLIYPGDVLLLAMTPEGPRLSQLETVKLSPRIRYDAIPARSDAIPTIPTEAIAPFIARAGVVDAVNLLNMPRILGSDDDRMFMMMGDTAYATPGDGVTKNWYVIRQGSDLIDPDTGDSLGKEAIMVATATTLVPGMPQTLKIDRATMEVTKGDRLMPATSDDIAGMVPRAPETGIDGKIISAFGGAKATARYATVVLNRGKAHGLAPGHVLAVYRPGRVVGGKPDRQDAKHQINELAVYRHEPKEYRNFWEELLDLVDPFDYFFQAHSDGRRGWRYLGTKCLPDGSVIEPNTTYDPKVELVDCPADVARRKWAYMDIGCLKHGKSVSYDQAFDPQEVYVPHCRPDPAIKLPDQRSGLVMVYRVFDKVSYALVMESTGPIYLLDSVRNP